MTALFAHIVTVGTSLLLNAKKKYPEPSDEQLLEFVKSDPKAASAELNTILPQLEAMKDKQHRVYLLHSDTEEGRRCASILKSFLEGLGLRLSAEVREVPKLGEEKEFKKGLANLLEGVVEIIRGHYPEDRVFIYATGGFKPETAIAFLAGNLPGLGAPVFYIHEKFREVVRLPALPLSFRRKQKFFSLMEHFCRNIKVPELQLRERFRPEVVSEAERLGWIEKVGEDYEITPMGLLLWQKFESLGLIKTKSRR
ncbi:MAG: putative CRISPR-associated protein [Candidatus Hadarchaeales archaeon]